MARNILTALALVTVTLTGVALADPGPADPPVDLSRLRVSHLERSRPPTPDLRKAEVDTVYLLGGPDRMDGTFEDLDGNPEWYDWTPVDVTASGVDNAWQVTDTYVINGSYSEVCGTEFLQPDGTYDFGYGDNWRMALNASFTIDPAVSHTVRITGEMIVHTEATYDFVYLQVNRAGIWENMTEEAVWDDYQEVSIDLSTTLLPGEYAGAASDEIRVRFYFESDGAFSDQGGDIDTDGACRLDDLTVRIDGSVSDFEDFEDGDSGVWQNEVLPACGNFGALYEGLHDVDPCYENSSVQVAFIDDNQVVPGTGGTPCITWCYGPDGYIVNNTGGLLGPEFHIQCGVLSPALAWIPGHDALVCRHDLYIHEPFTASSGGTCYMWWVRSTASEDPVMLEAAPWETNWVVYYGGPYYTQNGGANLTTYLVPDRKWVQVRMMVWEVGYLWGIDGADGTPHPYFDNFRIYSYPYGGPAMSGDRIFLAQSSFPEFGDIDYGDLGSNSIRFDMGNNISNDDFNDPGDSVWVDVVPARLGSTLQELPRMTVRMKANPLFDPYRSLPSGFTQNGNIITGHVLGDSTYNAAGNLVENRYHFDLPDTGFFYPGDVIHYIFEAWDNQGGDIGHTTFPADTAGFASFQHDLQFSPFFVCRGLPTMFSDTPGDQPTVLFWEDEGHRGGYDEWLGALKGAGMVEGVDYDVYYTQAPSSGLGNGLGGRATSAQIDGYDTLLYTCGYLSAYSLGYGNFDGDPSQDIQLLNAWFARGGKKAFFTGDNLIFDLRSAGGLGPALLNNYFGVQFVDSDLGPRIDNQFTPGVETLLSPVVFPSVSHFVAYGGCPDINEFDAVEATGTGVRLAEFTDPMGNGGAYPYAAATYNYNSTTDTEVISMPFDFQWLYNAPDYVPPAGLEGVPARAILLRDVLEFFGHQLEGPIGVEDQVPDIRVLAVNAYPNPFNPKTTLALSLPRAGHVSVKIYNLRGELVRTLQDGHLVAGRHELVWDGCDGGGARSASGVYFAETRTPDDSHVTRMALIK